MALPTAQLLDDDGARRESVLARLASNPHLPSPPGIVLQILDKASRLDCTPADLAVLIHRDAALCGKVLKTVNSAFYGLPRSATSIKQAVALLGLKRLLSLVLSISLPALQQQAPPSAQIFWRESVAGATIAHELALYLRRPNPEDDLVAGLLRDIGVLALQQVYPAEHARLLEEFNRQRSSDWCRLERELLGVDHAEVSAFLLGRWLMPDDIVEAVRHHHAPERAEALPNDVGQRARLLAFASRIAQLQLDARQVELLRDIIAFGRQYYGLDETSLAAFLETLAKKIEEFAVPMDLDIGACEHYPLVLARAAEALAHLTLETSVDQMRILEQKRQAEQETQQWRAEANRLRNEAARDPLTGAFNRGCLEEQLRLRFRRACRRGSLMGLIFIDLDDFKNINDHFGHRFGDRVLQETAQHLFSVVREGDIVARYGGDEFCILVEDTLPEKMRGMAVRLGQILNDRTAHPEGHSVSLGAVVCLPRTCSVPATGLLDVADRAMYAAKANGKSQLSFVSLLSDADLRFLKEVERRRFGTWLTELGIRMSSQPTSEVRCIRARFEAPGRLVQRLGWLKAEQRREIVCEQRTTGRRFDEIASARGLLMYDQLSTLLALQLEPPECLAANLVKQGIFSGAAVREKLRNYYQWISR